MEQRRFGEAEAAFRQALDIYLESDRRSASTTATQLGITLANLGRHGEATAALLSAAVSWRQETGHWDANDLELLRQERARIESAEFTALADASIPDDLMDDFTAAIGPH